MSLYLDVDIKVDGEPQFLPEEEMGVFVDKYPGYFSALRKDYPEKLKTIEEFGKGSLVMGYARYFMKANELLYQFGELYNIIQEKEKDKLFEPIKEFKKLRSLAYSSRQEILPLELYKYLQKFIGDMVQWCEENDLLSKYNLTRKDYNV